MKTALAEAEKARQKDEVPIGAVIVCDGKIIARAHNLKEGTKKAIAHAELLAIEKANKKNGDWRLNDCELYVTIEPCLMCVGAIIQARLKKVVYGAPDKKFGAIESVVKSFEFKGWNHYPVIIGGVLAGECADIISKYFAAKRVKQ